MHTLKATSNSHMDPSGDNRISNPSPRDQGRSLEEICQRRAGRRRFLKTSIAFGATAASSSLSGCSDDSTNVSQSENKSIKANIESNFDFVEIQHGKGQDHLVAPDHKAEILIRWGDPLFEGAPQFDPKGQTSDSQSKQFGYNNDYIGYLELEASVDQQTRALLCVNHEYPQHALMFPDFEAKDKDQMTAERVAISQASVGATVVEVAQREGQWSVVLDSTYNRRISALDTVIEIAGPAAGHKRMQTSADPQGTTVIGTMGNCAGGMTPWGTYLSCEENVNYYFAGKLSKDHPEKANHKRMNVSIGGADWEQHDSRFNVSIEPNEVNRFGWVVEVDPLNPNSKPKKRTALGRFKHEGAETILSASGHLIIYMGDDQRFEYLYKFVSRDKVNLDEPASNADLLDHGTLYVAKFHDEGYLDWLPLRHDNPLLTAEFDSQADILIEARSAADILGATPMDRPEDVVTNPKTGKAYVMLTNNSKRKKSNAANQRTKNHFGHILEIAELDGELTGTRAEWNTLVKCGDPNNAKHQAQWHPNISANGWFANPDNGVVDSAGRLWVSSDQTSIVDLTGTNDGLWALETQGEGRGIGKMFFRSPAGAEVCGPIFSDNAESLFISIQHPGNFVSGKAATFEKPSTRWPDFSDDLPPRPSLMVIQKKQGGPVA